MDVFDIIEKTKKEKKSKKKDVSSKKPKSKKSKKEENSTAATNGDVLNTVADVNNNDHQKNGSLDHDLVDDVKENTTKEEEGEGDGWLDDEEHEEDSESATARMKSLNIKKTKKVTRTVKQEDGTEEQQEIEVDEDEEEEAKGWNKPGTTAKAEPTKPVEKPKAPVESPKPARSFMSKLKAREGGGSTLRGAGMMGRMRKVPNMADQASFPTLGNASNDKPVAGFTAVGAVNRTVGRGGQSGGNQGLNTSNRFGGLEN